MSTKKQIGFLLALSVFVMAAAQGDADGDSAKGALITIDNLDKMVMPVIVKIGDASGNFQVVRLRVDIWERGGSWTFKIPFDDQARVRRIGSGS